MNTTLLKYSLLANATFSITCGIVIFAYTNALSKVFNGFDNLYLQILGAGLILFAAQLIWVALQKTINLKMARDITRLDWAWVAGSVLLILFMQNSLSLIAIDLIAATALVVALCAIFQTRGIKQQKPMPQQPKDVSFSG